MTKHIVILFYTTTRALADEERAKVAVLPDSRKRGNWVTPKINIYFMYTIYTYSALIQVNEIYADMNLESRAYVIFLFAFGVGEKKVYISYI